MACKVFVGSLPLGTKPKELRHLFQNFGIVIECDVKNRCGFIHMETPVMAETAILALNGSEFKGQMINVEPGRSKEMPSNMGQAPPNKMIHDSNEQGGHGMNFQGTGGGNRGLRRGSGPPGMGGHFNARGGMSNRGSGPSHRGGGMGVGNPFNNNRGGMQNRGGMMTGSGRGGGMGAAGGMNNRGGPHAGRGGFNNRNQTTDGTSGGPVRNSPSFKQRHSPYQPPINEAEPSEGGPPTRSGKFGGNQRGGFNGPQNRNQHSQQRNNNWGNQSHGGGPQQQHGGDFDDMNAMGGGRVGGNLRNPHFGNSFGQDRRGFTLDNTQPPMQPHQRQQHFAGHRGQNERSNFHAHDNESAGFRSMSDGPPHRGRGGGRGNFGPGRGGRGGGRGNFGGGREGGPGNFGPPNEHPVNSYNKEFPALQPARGRGGFGGGNRGGFNRFQQ